jgi:enamine deaminase RidA (YjgF/YER057c/UK114 family)
VLSAIGLLKGNKLPANSTPEAMRTQGVRRMWIDMTLRKCALLPVLCLVGFAAGWAQNQTVNQQKTTKEKRTMEKQQTNVRFINRAPVGYSHVVEVKGGRTLYISGQIALDKDGNLVGRNDFRAQVEQVFENLKARLQEGGATFRDVVKLNYYLTDASGVQAVRDIRNNYINTESPPASTLVVVKQLVRKEYLIEIEAIAVVSE